MIIILRIFYLVLFLTRCAVTSHVEDTDGWLINHHYCIDILINYSGIHTATNKCVVSKIVIIITTQMSCQDRENENGRGL